MGRPISQTTRSVTFRARMFPGEVDMLAALAESAGLAGSDIVRLLVREAYALKFGDRKPKPRRAAPEASKGGA